MDKQSKQRELASCPTSNDWLAVRSSSPNTRVSTISSTSLLRSLMTFVTCTYSSRLKDHKSTSVIYSSVVSYITFLLEIIYAYVAYTQSCLLFSLFEAIYTHGLLPNEISCNLIFLGRMTASTWKHAINAIFCGGGIVASYSLFSVFQEEM